MDTKITTSPTRLDVESVEEELERVGGVRALGWLIENRQVYVEVHEETPVGPNVVRKSIMFDHKTVNVTLQAQQVSFGLWSCAHLQQFALLGHVILAELAETFYPLFRYDGRLIASCRLPESGLKRASFCWHHFDSPLYQLRHIVLFYSRNLKDPNYRLIIAKVLTIALLEGTLTYVKEFIPDFNMLRHRTGPAGATSTSVSQDFGTTGHLREFHKLESTRQPSIYYLY
ncbi:unnamed protein product [Protopolystoma xenopodis]|uniref:Uncharacterized protein n=1 Tax=Protopolystoma xenopodis TaxID=117903 RepID=A0A448XGH2_9PLAT|nr:unnamed protein product [Protopolystoma xenopodis]